MQPTPDDKEPEFGLAQIGQVALRIHDVDSAIEFYRDALGMKFLFSTGTMAFFDCGGVRLMLSMPERPEFDRPGSILYFKVDDLEGCQVDADRPRRTVHRRTPPDRANARPRTLDVVLQRPLGQHAGPNERSAGLTEDSVVRRCQHGLAPQTGHNEIDVVRVEGSPPSLRPASLQLSTMLLNAAGTAVPAASYLP